MILSERSGRIRTRELKEEALRNNWTNRGGRRGNFQDGSYDGRSENSETNSKKLLARPNQHTDNRGGNFEKQ